MSSQLIKVIDKLQNTFTLESGDINLCQSIMDTIRNKEYYKIDPIIEFSLNCKILEELISFLNFMYNTLKEDENEVVYYFLNNIFMKTIDLYTLEEIKYLASLCKNEIKDKVVKYATIYKIPNDMDDSI